MKWIISGFTPSILMDKPYTLHCDPLTEEEFQESIFDAYSCVRQKDVAEKLGVAFNPEFIKARPGDLIYAAHFDNKKLKYKVFRVESPAKPLTQHDIDVMRELAVGNFTDPIIG